MKVVVTGADGFLGWHLRVRAHAEGIHELLPAQRDNWAELASLVKSADAIVHIAGVNRGEPDVVERGNEALARDVARAVEGAGGPRTLVYANSIQSGNGTPYGTGKEVAARLLRASVESSGGTFVDVQLPNLFGEHGRPDYNSFVATFVEHAVLGTQPQVVDRAVPLLHSQSAAATLLDALTGAPGVVRPRATDISVSRVWDLLQGFADTYAVGDVPKLSSQFEVDLFNTFRSRLFPERYPIALTAHADDRGRLVETVRSHGGQGQTFVSTTRPGVTRGEHFHLRKIERFVVLSGRATIGLRKVLGTDVVRFDVSGELPVIVDMPTMWAHNITNTGDEELVTLFWTNELFDPSDPDTYRELVGSEKVESC
ncbi:polysaccharide biosynthesis C-terminal domain-containing protein [Terrabacter sp. C0L_2]|uniref:polysaccharide biosynthesis C-terminal domain-containing protein n=1 Tax=Terrabacter sp. C0L_2 TaxID=3108389 RepID=UPI002ECFFB0D|nr:NAD-dependent epimerase/dehydratase family protein [Terrabacter sp. C0L_2]